MYSKYTTAVLTVSLVMALVATFAVALRLRARRIKKQPLGIDDYTILSALMGALGLAGNAVWGCVDGGIGAPSALLAQRPNLMVRFLKFVFADMVLYLVSISLVKTSVVLLYRRIFIMKSFKAVANVTLVVIAAWCLAFLFWYVFALNPVSGHWDPLLAASPGPQAGLNQVLIATTDLGVDLFILCLPLPVIRSLHMSKKRKLLTAGIFWLGAFCIVASSVRLFYTVQFNHVNQEVDHSQLSSTTKNLTIWSRIELCASIVSACLPTLAPLTADASKLSSVLRSFQSLLSLSSSQGLHSATRNRDGESEDEVLVQRAWTKLKSGSSKSEVPTVEMHDLEQSRPSQV